jgi:hypothetical protein
MYVCTEEESQVSTEHVKQLTKRGWMRDVGGVCRERDSEDVIKCDYEKQRSSDR